MISRREAIHALGALSAGTLLTEAARGWGLGAPTDRADAQDDPTRTLAAGAPTSTQRVALIDAMKQKTANIETLFKSRTRTAASVSDFDMPYRLFVPASTARLPLVMYLHGSGGNGTDNVKQMNLGNVFGSRVWALDENQREFPCYVVAPQSDRGWARYGDPAPGDSIARLVQGLGDGARVAMQLIDELCREFPIDSQRIYITGQSLGGGGVWHMLTHRPQFFAAAAICCGSATLDNVAAAARTPLWNFHGDADATVPVQVSRERVLTMRNAGGKPFATEYPGVGHNVWDFAYTEPALVKWLFTQRRG